ncbi:hypothetical protein OROGR_017485 [Orobanche gracilis]
MSRLGFKSVVYHGDVYLGELETVPVNDRNFQFPNNEIRIQHIAPNSERCHPLSVLQTISSASVRCKLEPGSNGNLSSSIEQSSLINLHASCFYELKTDPVRESGMTAEIKRYVEDRALLKQYAETNCVVDGGKVYKIQQEEIRLLSDANHRVVRPVVRLPEKNIVLTRINPENRDTSVLVRLRPAWEDLRSYLIAKGRKRLLDPEAHLINPKQLLDRVVCVKSDGHLLLGARKSLLNVFQVGNCHPKMAMVIDDRLKVWEYKDQPRVHVVPAFTPYYAPQAEIANAVPVLCVARNVACNVRGGFFKEFDENLLRRISDIFYEDEVVNLPSAPDVSNFLISEDASFVPNGNPNVSIAEGMNGPEVSQRLEEKNIMNAVSCPMVINFESKSDSSNLPVAHVASVTAPASTRVALPSEKPSLLGDPFRKDSMYSGSTEPPLLSRLPWQAPLLQPQGSWLVEDDTSRGNFSSRNPGTVPNSDPLERQQGHQNSLTRGTSSSVPPELSHSSLAKNEKINSGIGIQKHSLLQFGEPKFEGDKMNLLPSLSICVLQEIGRRCRSKVEFRPVVSKSDALQFSVEVFFTGEKIGVGMGKTRKDAQQQAAENALRCLADDYVSYIAPCSITMESDIGKSFIEKENGFIWDNVKPGSEEPPANNGYPKQNTSEVGTFGYSSHH